jgi:hypothetical protein
MNWMTFLELLEALLTEHGKTLKLEMSEAEHHSHRVRVSERPLISFEGPFFASSDRRILSWRDFMKKLDTDVIIIGAGISGLACAKNFMKEGIRFLILEACQRVGGRIKSDRVDGFIL